MKLLILDKNQNLHEKPMEGRGDVFVIVHDECTSCWSNGNDVILQLIVAVVERHRCWVLAGLDDLGPHKLPHEFSELSLFFVPKIPNSGFICLKN